LLFQIAVELRNQLDLGAEGSDYLLRRVSERYFIALENYFYDILGGNRVFSPYYLDKIGTDKYNELVEKIHRYRELRIYLQKDWIKKQLKELDSIGNECKEFNLTEYLCNSIDNKNISRDGTNNIICLQDMIQEYHNNPSECTKGIKFFSTLDEIYRSLSKIMKTIEYRYRNRYVMANLCLVPIFKAEELKLLLKRNGLMTTYNFTRSILFKNDVPEFCHNDLISKLGFSRKTLNNYYYRSRPPDPNNDNSGLIVVQKDMIGDNERENLRDIFLYYLIATGSAL
jgi:hypothetical protein